VDSGDLIAQRYRLDRRLGAGGMGEVWAATHVVTGRVVALKLLRPRDDDATARRRVLREARAACAVQHPNVVAIHDVLEAEDGAPILVMDLLEGESLRARLEREKKLSAKEVARIARPVLDALAAAHKAGIVHRDLKPDNLFVTSDGVKILDFGVAKLLAAEGFAKGSGTLTAEGAMVGTPYYMAPEQAFGEAIDARADLWAMGILMYECLAGEPPTRGDNLGQVLRLLTTGKLTPLLERAPGTPESLARIISSLLSIDTATRPSDAAVVRDALDAIDFTALPSVVPPPPPNALSQGEPQPSLAQSDDGAAHSVIPTPPKKSGSGPLALLILALASTVAGIAMFRGFSAHSPQTPAPASSSLAAPTVTASSEATPAPSASQLAASASVRVPVAPARSISVRSTHGPAPQPTASSPTAEPATKLLTQPPF
jgi:serine/threonine-protein kinase